MNLPTKDAYLDDDAQKLAELFVNDYSHMFTRDKAYWQQTIAALIRVHDDKLGRRALLEKNRNFIQHLRTEEDLKNHNV